MELVIFNNREDTPLRSVCYIRPPSSGLAKHPASAVYLRTILSPRQFDFTPSAKDAGLFDHSLCYQCSSCSHVNSTSIVTTSSFEHYSPCIKFKQTTPKASVTIFTIWFSPPLAYNQKLASSHKIPDPVMPALTTHMTLKPKSHSETTAHPYSSSDASNRHSGATHTSETNGFNPATAFHAAL